MLNTKTKTYPSHVLEDELRQRGIAVQCVWEMRGPPNTFVEWIVCYIVGNTVMLVETHKNGHGWNAFTPCADGEISATVDDVIARCCREIPGQPVPIASGVPFDGRKS